MHNCMYSCKVYAYIHTHTIHAYIHANTHTQIAKAYDPALIPRNASSIDWWDFAQYQACFSTQVCTHMHDDVCACTYTVLYAMCTHLKKKLKLYSTNPWQMDTNQTSNYIVNSKLQLSTQQFKQNVRVFVYGKCSSMQMWHMWPYIRARGVICNHRRSAPQQLHIHTHIHTHTNTDTYIYEYIHTYKQQTYMHSAVLHTYTYTYTCIQQQTYMHSLRLPAAQFYAYIRMARHIHVHINKVWASILRI